MKTTKKKVRRNPARTKENLLQAGIKLFSARGYDGVAVDEIVDQAGCNKRMLYHYFGNKDGLYVEVLREVFGKLENIELEGTAETSTTEDAIREILACYFDFLQQNPDFVNLLMWENLNQARFLDAHPNLLSKHPILQRLDEILKRGRLRGEIEGAPDSRHLLVLLIGVCFIYVSNRHTLHHTLGLDLRRPSVLRKGLQLAQEMFIHGLIRKSR
jgi:TetR/AcrR family transcriptional regulator